VTLKGIRRGRWLARWRRPVVNQRTSVSSEFNCTLLHCIQLEIAPTHSETFTKNTSIMTVAGLAFGKNRKPELINEVNKPLYSINIIRSAVYRINNKGPALTLEAHHSQTIDDFISPRHTYGVRPSRYDRYHQWTMSWMPKLTRRSWCRISWSTAGCQTIWYPRDSNFSRMAWMKTGLHRRRSDSSQSENTLVKLESDSSPYLWEY